MPDHKKEETLALAASQRCIRIIYVYICFEYAVEYHTTHVISLYPIAPDHTKQIPRTVCLPGYTEMPDTP